MTNRRRPCRAPWATGFPFRASCRFLRHACAAVPHCAAPRPGPLPAGPGSRLNQSAAQPPTHRVLSSQQDRVRRAGGSPQSHRAKSADGRLCAATGAHWCPERSPQTGSSGTPLRECTCPAPAVTLRPLSFPSPASSLLPCPPPCKSRPGPGAPFLLTPFSILRAAAFRTLHFSSTSTPRRKTRRDFDNKLRRGKGKIKRVQEISRTIGQRQEFPAHGTGSETNDATQPTCHPTRPITAHRVRHWPFQLPVTLVSGTAGSLPPPHLDQTFIRPSYHDLVNSSAFPILIASCCHALPKHHLATLLELKDPTAWNRDAARLRAVI
jgi:hypothetical protein